MRQLARDRDAVPEGRCIPRFQVYRISAQIDYLLVWRSIRRDAPGLNAGSNAGVENASRSFDAPREPRQFTRLGPHHDKVLFSVRERTLSNAAPLMVMGGACAPSAATSLKLIRVGSRGVATGRASRSLPIIAPAAGRLNRSQATRRPRLALCLVDPAAAQDR